MKQVLGVVFGLVLLAAVGMLSFLWFAGGEGEPSRDVVAEPVVPTEPSSYTYHVRTEESEARFVIDEVLRGEPTTVVGRTDQIDGSISVQLNPGAVTVGEFVINVRTIRTDNEIRDRSIRTLILQSNRDEFEFSTFRPTQVDGVPERIDFGDRLDLTITGDLTVRDVTRTVSFDASLEIASEERLTGTATTTVTWDQFGITIPYVGGNSIVSAVADNLDLDLEFVATAGDDS